MAENRNSIKNLSAFTLGAFMPVLTVMAAVDNIIPEFAGSNFKAAIIKLALFFVAAAVPLICGWGSRVYNAGLRRTGRAAAALTGYAAAMALAAAAGWTGWVTPAGLAAGIVVVIMLADDRWGASGSSWWMIGIFFVFINIIYASHLIIIVELIVALLLTIIPVCALVAALCHAGEMKLRAVVVLALMFLAIIWAGGRADYYSSYQQVYSKWRMPRISSTEFDRMKQKAFGELMIPTLLPGHSGIKIYYRGTLNNGYREVLSSMPYISELTLEPRDAAMGFMLSIKENKRLLDMLKEREKDFDVVILDAGFQNVAAATLAVPRYIALAENGFLVVDRQIELDSHIRSRLEESFKFKFQLPYPARYTVYTNRETDMDLTRFDRDLARLFPNNPYVPPEIMSFLFSKVAEVSREQESNEAKQVMVWPYRNILEPGNNSVLWIGLGIMAVYFAARLIFGGEAQYGVVLDGGEDGFFLGGISGMVVLICAAAEIMPAVPMICLMVMMTALMCGDGETARKIKYFTAVIIIICGAAFVPYGWILWLLAALFIFKIIPRMPAAIIVAAGVTAITAWGFFAGYQPAIFPALIAFAAAGPMFCDAFKPLRNNCAAISYDCALLVGIAAGIAAGAWLGAESLAAAALLMVVWRGPALLRLGRGEGR